MGFLSKVELFITKPPLISVTVLKRAPQIRLQATYIWYVDINE